MKLAIVGVTGMVGKVMLKVLEEEHFQITELIPVASENSVGKELEWRGKKYKIINVTEALHRNPDIALFSAGGATSLEWSPKFSERGTFVIDNSSAFRMVSNVPLVVPEINADSLNKDSKIIANPNCSTIQMVMVLHPLHIKYRLKRLVISTYQSFTGTGMKAVRQYESERDGLMLNGPRAYSHPIFENCIPQCDVFTENDYTKEEMKLVHETRKILNTKDINITATAVRIPVYGGHSESVNVEFYEKPDIEEIKKLLSVAKGIQLMDNPELSIYPTPQQARDKNEVLVGRIRLDESQDNTINLWICADNLRKGAATNAVQIAQYLVNQKYI